MASFDTDIDVTVYSETQSVDIQNFGKMVWATEAVEVGFTETYKIYESNSDAQADADLSAATKIALAFFFSQKLRPKEIIVAPVTYATIGTSLSALLIEYDDFYGVACASRVQADQDATADWCLANSRIASCQSSDAAILAATPANLFLVQQAAGNDRAFGAWHHDDDEPVDLCWLAAILSCDMDTQSSVAHDKNLVGCSANPTADVNPTQKAAVLAAGGNLYLPLKGDPVMRPGVMFSDDWIEDTILSDWTKARIEEALARLVKRKSAANSKVAYTDPGIAECEAEIRGHFDRGAKIGHYVENSLVLNVPKLVDITPAVRATRKLTISGSVQKAGAIKDIDFNIGITF